MAKNSFVAEVAFKYQMMRKNNKASQLPSLVQPTYQHDVKDDESILNIVIDVGYLLRKVVWPKDGTHNNVLQRNFSYVSKKYEHCTKKRSFPLRISSVNVTKSAVSCGFSHIY